MADLPCSGVELPAYVVHYDAPRWCETTVAALHRSVGLDVRVTVVHNGGTEPSLPAGVELFRPGRNLGFAGGANAGLARWAREDAPYVAICSHDVQPEPTALLALVDALDRDPSLGAVGPENLTRVRRSPPFRPAEDPRLSWLCGSLMVLRREAVMAVGGFDERFGSYVEDVEYGYRLSEAGWRVSTVPGVRAATKGSSSHRALAMTDSNWLLLAILRAPSPGRRTRLRLALVGLIARSLLGALVSKDRAPSLRYARERLRVFRASFRRAPKSTLEASRLRRMVDLGILR